MERVRGKWIGHLAVTVAAAFPAYVVDAGVLAVIAHGLPPVPLKRESDLEFRQDSLKLAVADAKLGGRPAA